MQASIVGDLYQERAADILEEMDPDEAVDLLQDFRDRREELIELSGRGRGRGCRRAARHPEDSAGAS